mgnify:CR=1 FL=1
MKTKVFKTDWFAGLVITCVFIIFSNSDFLESVERSAYDYGVKSSSRIASDKIAIIAIDDKSIDRIGRFPWSRDIHAQMYDVLTESGAKVIGQTTFFSEPQLDPGLKLIREIKDYFSESNLSHVPEKIHKIDAAINQSRKLVNKKSDKNGRIAVDNIANALGHAPLHQQIDVEIDTITNQLESAETSLDTDNIFAQSIQHAGNVIFNVPVIHGPLHGKPDGEPPPFITKNRLLKNNIVASDKRYTAPLPVVEMKYPIAILGTQADAIGTTIPLLDIDGSIRTEALVVNYFGDYYPSMALMLAAKNLNLSIQDIKITSDSNIKLGRLKIKTNSLSMMNTFFYHQDNNTQIFPVDSFSDVLDGNISTEKYNNKIVLIGPTALGVGDTFSTPINSAMPPVIMLAHSVSSILNEDFFIVPE